MYLLWAYAYNKNRGPKKARCVKCRPDTTYFKPRPVDALVVGGIGMGALNILNQSGIKVFHAQAPTVHENVALLKVGNLPEFSSQNTCAGHGHGGGCGH